MDLVSHYLDFNSTSPLSQSVTDWLKSGDFVFANPASQHALGKLSKKVINQVTDSVFKSFSIDPKTYGIVYHSGASEAISSFLYSFYIWARKSNQKLLVCYSNLDHPAVVSQSQKLWDEDVLFLPLEINQDFTYNDEKNLYEIQKIKREHPNLIILYHHLWVHNEVGTIAALEQLKVFKNIDNLYIHVDAVQSPGKILDWRKLAVGDIFTYSAHKFGAFKGIGFSFYLKTLPLNPFITGGGQQVFRSGTENVMGIKSIQLALDDLVQINIRDNYQVKSRVEKILVNELNGIGEVISLRGHHLNSNTIYFYLNNVTSDVALALFDLNGLMISAGSACSSGTAKSSAVLLHLGLSSVSRNGLRLSLPFHLKNDEIDDIESKLKIIFRKIREF